MIKFAFELLDRMSGPAAKISSQLSKVDKALAANAASTAALEGKTDKASMKTLKSLERQAGALNKQKEKLLGGQVAIAGKTAAEAKLAAKTKDTTEKTKAAADKASKQTVAVKGMGEAAQTAAVKMMALAAAVGLGAAGAQTLLDAQRYKDTTSAALTFALGTGKAAGEAMADVQRIANVLGTSVNETMDKFRGLQSSGFDARESKILMQLAADLKVYNQGQDVAIGAIAEPIKAIKNGGILSVDSFKGLEAAGLSRAELNERIAKSIGVKVSGMTDDRATMVINQALRKIPRGQQSMQKLMDLTLEAMGQKELGEGVQSFHDKTVTGAIDKVKNRWDSLIKSVNGSPLGERLVAILNRVAEALNPDGAGKGIVETLDKIVGMASRAYDGMKPLIDAFSSGFGEGFGSALDDLMEFVDLVGVGGPSSLSFGNALKWIGTALGELAVGVIAVVGGLAWLTSTIVEAVATLPANLRDIGRMTINGLVDGFEAMKGRLSAAVDGIKENVVGRLKSLLSIHSPSRVMAELGGYTAEGFAVGIERGAPQVASAAKTGMVTPTLRATVGASGGGGRGSVTIESGAVQINATGSDVDTDRLAMLVEERLRALLTGSTLELGAT